jgi:coenzyme Q-binding protein COQ10
MPKIAVSRPVRHGAGEMFDLVADVERYPEFVPLCEKLVLHSRSRDAGKDVLLADMSVGYKSFRETFTTRVTVDRAALLIAVSYVTGPFRRMDAHWRFEPAAPGQSVVHFAVDYEFRSRILAALMGGMFDYAFRKFAEAFEARADKVYGARRMLPPRAAS